jgi:ATP-binding cassette subfamily C protein
MPGRQQSPADPNAPLRQALGAARDLVISISAFSACLNLLYIAPSLYMLQVYDRVVPTRGGLTLLALTVMLAVAVLTIGLLDIARSRLLVRMSARIERLLARSLVDGLFRAPPGPRSKTSDLLREFDSLRQILGGVGILALCDIPWTPIYIIICFVLHWALGTFALLCGLILLCVTWSNERNAKAAATRASASSRTFYQAFDASLVGADVAAALGMQGALTQRHRIDRERLTQDQVRASLSATKYVTTAKISRLLMQSLALGLGAYLAINQQISAGAIFAVSLLLSRALAPIESVTGAWRSLAQAQLAWANLNRFLIASEPRDTKTILPRPLGAIELDAVAIAAPDRSRLLLQGIGFSVRPGEMLGIMGASGAGKSTLLRAIVGLAPIQSGAIRIDAAKISDWESGQLAEASGYVAQASPLFPGTVRENISRFAQHVGKPPAEIDVEVVRVAQLCNAHEMILGLSSGYDTLIGQGGLPLSTGQGQQIALCRALYGAPSMLFLDEPNAGLDGRAEAALIALLSQLRASGVTIIIAAHQPRLLEAADKLAVLRDGRLLYYGEREEVILRLSGPTPSRASA